MHGSSYGRPPAHERVATPSRTSFVWCCPLISDSTSHPNTSQSYPRPVILHIQLIPPLQHRLIHALRQGIPQTRQPLANLARVTTRRLRLEVGHVDIAEVNVRPRELLDALLPGPLGIRGFSLWGGGIAGGHVQLYSPPSCRLVRDIVGWVVWLAGFCYRAACSEPPVCVPSGVRCPENDGVTLSPSRGPRFPHLQNALKYYLHVRRGTCTCRCLYRPCHHQL